MVKNALGIKSFIVLKGNGRNTNSMHFKLFLLTNSSPNILLFSDKRTKVIAYTDKGNSKIIFLRKGWYYVWNRDAMSCQLFWRLEASVSILIHMHNMLYMSVLAAWTQIFEHINFISGGDSELRENAILLYNPDKLYEHITHGSFLSSQYMRFLISVIRIHYLFFLPSLLFKISFYKL